MFYSRQIEHFYYTLTVFQNPLIKCKTYPARDNRPRKKAEKALGSLRREIVILPFSFADVLCILKIAVENAHLFEWIVIGMGQGAAQHNLSTRRKRKKEIDSLSSGERKRKSPNHE